MMDSEKQKKVDVVLDLMFLTDVSVKDLSIRIAEMECRNLADVQKKIKGFLYPEHNIVEPN